MKILSAVLPELIDGRVYKYFSRRVLFLRRAMKKEFPPHVHDDEFYLQSVLLQFESGEKQFRRAWTLTEATPEEVVEYWLRLCVKTDEVVA